MQNFDSAWLGIMGFLFLVGVFAVVSSKATWKYTESERSTLFAVGIAVIICSLAAAIVPNVR